MLLHYCVNMSIFAINILIHGKCSFFSSNERRKFGTESGIGKHSAALCPPGGGFKRGVVAYLDS